MGADLSLLPEGGGGEGSVFSMPGYLVNFDRSLR